MMKKKNVSYRLVNSFTIEINSDFHIEEYKKDGDVTKLVIKDEEIKLKDSFKFRFDERDIEYDINKIVKVDDGTYLLQTDKRNRTTLYILPLLGFLNTCDVKKKFNKKTLEEISKYCYNTYLINAYIGGEGIDSLEGYLYLKFRYSSHKTYQSVELLVTEHPLFVKIIDDRKSFIYIKLRIPGEYMEDIRLFLKGKYSKLSKDLKRNIMNFHKLHQKSNLYQILYKKDEDCNYRKILEKELNTCLKGAELDDVPSLEENLIKI